MIIIRKVFHSKPTSGLNNYPPTGGVYRGGYNRGGQPCELSTFTQSKPSHSVLRVLLNHAGKQSCCGLAPVCKKCHEDIDLKEGGSYESQEKYTCGIKRTTYHHTGCVPEKA
nr:hypothetical protein L203_00310 [Cryptococcus depauperatus CBS 7841]